MSDRPIDCTQAKPDRGDLIVSAGSPELEDGCGLYMICMGDNDDNQVLTDSEVKIQNLFMITNVISNKISSVSKLDFNMSNS